MNDWDKVEKRRRQATEQDIFFEYVNLIYALMERWRIIMIWIVNN